MNYKKNYIGYWYLPKNREDKVFGELIIDDKNNINLDLCGNFGDITSLSNLNEEDIINGFTKCGKEITLSTCSSGGFKLNMPGIPSIQYKPTYIIMGKAYDSLNSCLVRTIEAEFTLLDKWVNINPFEFEINNNEKEYNVYYKLPNSRAYTCKNFKFSICFGGKVNSDRLKSVEIKQRTYIKFEFEEEIKLTDSLDYIIDFSRFLTLCIGEESNISNIRVKDNTNNELEVFWNRMSNRDESNTKIENILIPFNLINNNFGEILERWYQVNKELEPIISYIIEGYDKVFHIPMTYLKIVQALEAFSRKMRNNNKEDESSYNKKIRYILNSIDNEEYREWLEGKLRYANEPTLNSRIKELLKEVDFFLNLTSNERKSVASKISLTRNYFTHFDEANKDNAMTTEEIYYSTVVMQLALRVLIMLELGVDRNLIEGQVISCEGYKLNIFYRYFKKKK